LIIKIFLLQDHILAYALNSNLSCYST